MATFYVGTRPVLKGRSSGEMVNPYTSMTGKAKGTGTYSFYPLYSTSHVLDGAPDNHHIPGTGYFPGDVFLSQVFLGTVTYIHPLSGEFRDGYGFGRFNPDLFKGLTGAKAFPSSFGHEERENEYKLRQYRFKGVTSTETLSDAVTTLGHAPRTEAEGAPSSFGYFRPDEVHGVASAVVFTSGYGQAVPAGYDNAYGRNRIQEWRGTPSSRAL